MISLPERKLREPLSGTWCSPGKRKEQDFWGKRAMALRASVWSWPMLGLCSSLGAYEITWPGLMMGWGRSVLREVSPISWQGRAILPEEGAVDDGDRYHAWSAFLSELQLAF